ncbi:MAG: hypothetical protein R3C09_11270 [Pirellulaceae bacterium]
MADMPDTQDSLIAQLRDADNFDAWESFARLMSPEQARGEAIDARSDLFSLGSVLYTLCTGRAPFRADSALAVLRLGVKQFAPSRRLPLH